MVIVSWPGDPDYGVTRDGRVFRIANPRSGYPVPYQLKPNLGRRGYLTVVVRKGAKRVRTPVHRLVAETFIPNPHNKPEVAHDDGVRTHNAASNLRWATRKENNNDRFGHGTVQRGEAVRSAKLTEQTVETARRLRRTGFLHREIAEEFGVSRRCIGKLLNGETWAHV